jgi:hypothetical protein
MSSEVPAEVRTAAVPAGGRARRVGLFATAVLALSVLLAIITGTHRAVPALDPDDSGPDGGLAVVEVLRQHGVQVSVVRSADRLPVLTGSATLVLGNAAYLGTTAAQRFVGAGRNGARVVLLMPTATAMNELGYPIEVLSGGSSDALASHCTTTTAAVGDTLGFASPRLIPGPSATGCFPYAVPAGGTEGSSGYAMVTIPSRGGQAEIVAVGFGEGLSNQRILDADNAGVAVRLLGNSQQLIWYQPDISDLDASTSTVDPWPAWQWPAAWVLGLAFVLFAVAIGRRLGRLVPEPLPVVVKASETTEARARLYQRAHDHARAAAILRYGTIRRLRQRLGSDGQANQPTADPSLVARVADATGLPPTVVADRLAGAPPPTDQALAQLAQHLTDLEEKVTRS